MAGRDEEWTCPRCGLVGDHHKTPDPERCDECCATDAALEMLAALKASWEWKGARPANAGDLARAAIAKAEGRTA